MDRLKVKDYRDQIELEDFYVHGTLNTLYLYFKAPRDLLINYYNDIESTEICFVMEFNLDEIVNKGSFDVDITNGAVKISPTKDNSDFDWSYVVVDPDEVEWWNDKIREVIIENLFKKLVK